MRAQVTLIADDDRYAMFFAMTHNPHRCAWCERLGDVVRDHLSKGKAFDDAP